MTEKKNTSTVSDYVGIANTSEWDEKDARVPVFHNNLRSSEESGFFSCFKINIITIIIIILVLVMRGLSFSFLTSALGGKMLPYEPRWLLQRLEAFNFFSSTKFIRNLEGDNKIKGEREGTRQGQRKYAISTFLNWLSST